MEERTGEVSPEMEGENDNTICSHHIENDESGGGEKTGNSSQAHLGDPDRPTQLPTST